MLSGYQTLLVDGLNLLGSRPDGWWRDRPAAMRRLVISLRELGTELPERTIVVFDGRTHRAVADAADDRVEVRFAPGGPDAADKVIATLARAATDPERVLVVSSDRRLLNSVKAAGAASVGSGSFAGRYLARRAGDAPP